MTNNDIKQKVSKDRLYFYINKWRKIIHSTSPINREKVIKAIEKACDILKYPLPKIVFTKSPREALSYLSDKQCSVSNYKPLKYDLSSLLTEKLFKNHQNQLYLGNIKLSSFLFNESYSSEYLYYVIYQNIYEYVDCWLDDLIDSEIIMSNPCEYEFYIEELNYDCDQNIWNTYKYLAEESPYILCFSHICLVIERPTKLHLDNLNYVHAEGKPAVIFNDGYNIYAYHGIDIPEKYGKYSYSQWKPEWLLELVGLENEELRSVIIREIGYDKFRQELPDSDFDFWQDSGLLNAQADFDIIDIWFTQNYPEGFFIDEYKNEKQSYKEYLKSVEETKETIKNLFCKFPKELISISEKRRYQKIAPNLTLNPLPEILKQNNYPHWNMSQYIPENNYVFTIFYGSNQSFYYVLCNQKEKDYLPIWYVSKYSQPQICAVNLTSLLLSIAECYQKGAYYVTKNEKTGIYYIEQNRTQVANIFQKFNPDYIHVWENIWDENKKSF